MSARVDRLAVGCEATDGFEDLAVELTRIIGAADSSTIDAAVQEGLARFGRHAGVDRMFTSLIDDDGLVADDWEWAAAGCSVIGPSVGSSFREVNGSAMELLRRGRTVSVADLDKIELSVTERDFATRNRVRAVVLCPIRVGQTLLGVIGLTKLEEPKDWSRTLLGQVEVLAQLLVPAVARTRDRGALAVAAARARRIADFIPDGLLMLTPAGAINWVSPSFTRSSGRTLNDLEAQPAAELAHPDDRDELTWGLARSSEEAASLTVRLRVAGEWRWSELSWRLVSEPDSGAPDEIVLSIRDVHDERLRSDQLARQALTDALTGVANREGLDRALAALGDCDVVLAFCDIDGFKVVNDVHGHATGDEVLCATANALVAAVRPGDVVARVGGDEFVVVVVDATPADADTLAARLLEAVGQARTPNGVGATASIGISRIGPATNAAGLRAVADEAMYRAKHARTSVPHR
jgi:diguanylate cyclase (GGDEF)-like protein/PAS domain S-box-containing protein